MCILRKIAVGWGIAWCAVLGFMAVIEGTAARAQSKPARNLVVQLDRGWEFRQMPSGQETANGWMPATVPGDVHLDLAANSKIPDPFFRDNEARLQWIEKENWEYRLSFDATPAMLSRSNVELVFDGLDAAAQVYVNGSLVLNADNMFRTWRVPVKSFLKAGKNQLRVVFPSPIKAAAEAAARDPFRQSSKTEEKTYIRKAAYEYGWDWGPRLVTSGIWRPVRLEAWDRVRVADFAIRQRDVSKEGAHVDAEVELEASAASDARVRVQYTDDDAPVVTERKVSLHQGRNVIDIPIEIRKPKLWYPAGYGEQPLYEFTASVDTSAGPVGTRKIKAGLRSVSLHRQLDQWGRSFEFIVNGIPVFAKGANVIPFDSFPSRVTTEHYRRMLESARDANMNMIRQWGGGYYESDEFYSICDELGIMVWQDFMFGNDWQPGTYAFKQNIEAEAEDQVRRLRNHPSIVLWCGNNETELAYNWAPRVSLPSGVRFYMWQDYLTEFSGILPRVVARLNAETPYWPSSPSADYEYLTDRFQSGDQHDWGVWHTRAPFTEYEKHHWRFVSEFGFQSFPELRTLESFTQSEDRGVSTPVMLAHQKANEGDSIIHDYMLKDYPEPKDFASFVYVSQVLQAEGIKIGAEQFRRNRHETMGALFWQLNDCWPVVSWSSIDYYGRWKALQYYARRFFAPILVSPHLEEGSVKTYIVSDKTQAVQATLRARLMDFDGKVLLDESQPVAVAPLVSKAYLDWPLKKLTDAGASNTSQVFIEVELTAGNTLLSRNIAYMAPTREVRLKPVKLAVDMTGSGGSYKVHITSPLLARSVYLSFGNLDARLSDNYFDLLPGESIDIAVESTATLNALKTAMNVVSLSDAFNNGNQSVFTAAPRKSTAVIVK
jgi:beta-mannosidase